MSAEVVVLLLFMVGVICFAIGRTSGRDEREETVLKRIIERRYRARVEREKVRTAEEVSSDIDTFIKGLTDDVH